MAEVRVVLCLLTVTVLARTHAKPMFGSLICDLFCEDYEDGLSGSTTTSLEDLMDVMWDPCGNCPTDRPSNRVPTTPPPPAGMTPVMPFMGSPWNMVFPPSAWGMNITVLPPVAPNGGPVYQILPFAPATPAPAAGPAAPAASPAAPAAPAASTAAPAAAATEAGATAAPTTAAA